VAAVLQQLIDYLAREMKEAGVTVHLSRTLDAAAVRAEQPEVVVLATGASYRFPFNWLIPPLFALGLMRTGWMARLTAHPRFKDFFFYRARTPRRALARQLAAQGIEVHPIGDCSRPGKTQEAIASAYELARQL
jgi:hypothetical protein